MSDELLRNKREGKAVSGDATLGEGRRFKALEPVLDEHAEWFGRVMRWTFYPDDPRSAEPLNDPTSFELWMRGARDDDFYEPDAINRLTDLYRDLRTASRALVAASAGGVRPAVGLMDGFIDLYDEFLSQLRRLERDSMLADSGIDAATGLRSRENMVFDLERELERRARRGRPFCLAFVRLDGHAALMAAQGKEAAFEQIKQAAAAIRKMARSYDDAYRLDNGEFVLSLKHSDLTGGMRAVERLRLYLSEQDAPFTMSYVVAEPVPGDDIRAMIVQSRKDLDANKEKPDVALRYKEVSPLARFAQDDEGADSASATDDGPGRRRF